MQTTIKQRLTKKPGSPRHLGAEHGFVLIVVVGMLTVLVVLGLSYAEQGRVALRGASNTRDMAALDALAETGFQFALRALHDDRNVRSASGTPAHLAALGGAGWSSRWGFNPDPTLGGAMPTGADRAPSRSDASSFQDSWRILFWNEETVEPLATWTGKAWGYGFKFRPGSDEQARRSMETQRYPQPASVLLDTVQLQPFARVRKFRVQCGANFGLVQVGIAPKDGGVNLNDVFDPATVNERPGVYELQPVGTGEGTAGMGAPYEVPASDARVPYASPDRRTLEVILGRVPQFANKNNEGRATTRYSPSSLRVLSGSVAVDNGLYNWLHYFEPYGGYRAFMIAGGPGALWVTDYTLVYGHKYRASTGFMTSATSGAPTTIWNVAGGDEPNRYGMEPSRHVLWTAMKGMAFTADGGYPYRGVGYLVDPNHYGSNDNRDYLWYPTGVWRNDPRLPGTNGETGNQYYRADQTFQGFGFDRFNPYRAGIDAVPADMCWGWTYLGPGAYGHPKARTFQLHFQNAVAQGRFWTDLLAAWYFGGAPGYTNYLGSTQASGYNNWAHLGSAYDALGIGSHWMPPTSHVWLPGFFNSGRISTDTEYQTRGGGPITTLTGKDEVSRGMTRWPGHMPPARMAASYALPMARWPADYVGQSNAHFCFNSFRLSLRAHGIQENWGDPLEPGATNADAASNRWYDAVDVNNTNFPVVYGLLTPEKIPSMLNRTVVAPHLHWKARMLDVECRLKRPVRLDGTAEVYDDVKNSWIPVQVGLRTPNAGKAYPGVDWNGDPASAGYNPYIPLRMKLKDPERPWNPDAVTVPELYNPWVEPKLLDKSKPYDPVTNPLYNSAAFLAELQNDAAVRHDYVKYPWMPSLREPVEIEAATGNPKLDALSGEAQLRVGLFGWDDANLKAAFVANGDPKTTPWPDWSKWVQDTGGVENFPWMPVRDFGAAPTWHDPPPVDGTGAAYPSPGWDGYLFEPRWYNGRTVNPAFLKDKAESDKLDDIAQYIALPGFGAAGLPSTLQCDSDAADNYWNFGAHGSGKALSGGVGALTGHRHVDPGRPNVIWGKMDFLTPEPVESCDLNGDLLGYGTGRPTDDVYTDAHIDLSLTECNWNDPREQRYASAMARPDDFRNWHEWFNQRKRTIPAQPGGADKTQRKDAAAPNNNPFRPCTNTVDGNLLWKNKDPNWGWSNALLSDGKIFQNRNDNAGTNAYDPQITSPPAPAAPLLRRVVRAATQSRDYYGATPEPEVKPHSVHGLPNPDYLLLYPGGPTSQHWADQFRPYFPVQLEEITAPAPNPYDDPDNNPETMANNPYPGAMPPRCKLVDDPGAGEPPASHTPISPVIPVPRTRVGDDGVPAVPAVGKDEAWRITRLGPRYQETIANEILDYQLNPWWPNPCVPVSELCVPLDKRAYPSEPRARVKVGALAGRNRWRSYAEHMDAEANGGSRVPKFYAYFNRFWTRTNHKAVRNWAGNPNDDQRPLGEPYRAISIAGNAALGIPDELINANEGKGMFPPTWQYFGQYPPAEATFQDRIKAFPYNVMEDQLGDDWRYLAQSVKLMTEPNMQKAPGRNHPFRTWADFVAFLGHLVYRAPLDPKATPELAAANANAVRTPLDGVDAYAVCHGSNADARNQGKFFDGSKIAGGAGGTIYADSLRSPIVAKEGFWPIAANYGRAPDAGADAYYPNPPPAGGWAAAEWKRRWDEVRGRDEAGLRVEQHYISERAANDVLVSFSNGQVGPIDFDGDGHVTMTRGYGKALVAGKVTDWSYANFTPEMPNAKPTGDIPQQKLWNADSSYHGQRQWSLLSGHPWHSVSGADATVEFEEYDDEPGYDASFANRGFWDDDANPKTMCPLNLKLGVQPKPDKRLWRKANKRDILLNCVTLPIKFHSNTFRVTVVVEVTDGEYKEVYAVRRFQKVISRVPGAVVAGVHGPFTGEFIEHASRAMSGVDPELNWLGVR